MASGAEVQFIVSEILVESIMKYLEFSEETEAETRKMTERVVTKIMISSAFRVIDVKNNPSTGNEIALIEMVIGNKP